MWIKRDWRHAPTSKRRKLVQALYDGQDSFRLQSESRGRQIYNFFADFWRSTPHPFAQMVFLLASSAAVATINDPRVLDAGLRLDSLAGRALQTILAFLIVFRTNQSYNRWWEGRILWGKMHWSCLELTQQAAAWIEDAQLARRIMNFSIAYAYAVKQILRRERLVAEDLDGIVDAGEVERMNNLSMPVVPYYCTDVIRQCIKKGLTDNPQSFGVNAVARGIDIPVSQLSMQFADMARVRNTPQPDCFRVMLHMFTLLYLLLLPLISYDTLGYFVIPEVLLTAYLMLGLQIAADYLEDPFGHDLTDLQLDLYVENIAAQCREAFYLGEKGNADLTVDGGGTRRQKPRRPSGAGSKPSGPLVGGAGVFYAVGASGGGGGGGGDARVGGEVGNAALGPPASPVPDALAYGSSSTANPDRAGLEGCGAVFAGGGRNGEEDGGGRGIECVGAGAGSRDGGSGGGAGGPALSPHQRRHEQTPMGSPMLGLPAASMEQGQGPPPAASPPRNLPQQQTPIGSPVRGLPAAASGEQKPSPAPYPPRKPMQQQTPVGTPMRGLPNMPGGQGHQRPGSTTTPVRKPMQQQTPIGTPMRGLPPPGEQNPAYASSPLLRPMRHQTPIGSPMLGLPASGEQGPVSATSAPVQQGAQYARPPMPAPRPRLEQQQQQQQQQQQADGVVEGFARGSALPPHQGLHQTPARGSMSQQQASGRDGGGAGGEERPSSHPPTMGAAGARHSFPRTASIGGGVGAGVYGRKNSSQFAILTDVTLASDEEDDNDSPVYNPAETSAGPTAAPVGPRRSRSPDRSANPSSSSSNGRAAPAPAPPVGTFHSNGTEALARNFLMKNRRAQEVSTPKRRSKPRPGRGKSPHDEVAGAAGEVPLGLGAVLSNPMSETMPNEVKSTAPP
eukprot:g10615.t1